MQDINLLQNKLKDQTHQWEKSSRLITVFLALIIVLELAAGGYFYYMTTSAESQKADLDKKNVALQSELTEMESDLDDAKNFQAQSKNIAMLLKSHVSWSEMITELTTSTFKSSQIFSLTTDTSGKIHVEGQAPTYADVGRMLLALETFDDFNQIDLLSTSLSDGATPGILYSVDVYARPDIFVTSN